VRALLRIFLACAGGAVAAVAVALYEARGIAAAIAEGGGARPALGGVVLHDFGLLGPLGLLVGMLVGIASLVLEPDRPRGPLGWIAVLRATPGDARLRAAAITPLVVLAFVTWVVGCAHAAAATMSAEGPRDAGLTMGLAGVGLLVALAGVVIALFPGTRRLLWATRASAPQVVDPVVTGGAALGLGTLVLAVGIGLGDAGGAGGVPAVGIFGVLRRPELDLRPVVCLLVLAIVAWSAPVVFARWPDEEDAPAPAVPAARPAPALAALPMVGSVGSVLVLALVSGLCVRSAYGLGGVPLVAEGIREFAPLGGPALGGLRRLTDHDRDGYSALFGGTDCDDTKKLVNPNAIDIPGNGVDEDCSGADTPLEATADVAGGGAGTSGAGPANRTPATGGAAVGADGGVPDGDGGAFGNVATAGDRAPRPRTYNVILFTVDTLRHDLGFSGYPKPVTPNLDRLAAKSTVFERAYSTASYTAKSVGPMHIGRYPSETLRDYEHYTTYSSANTFVAERLQKAGVRTVGGMCHYYFKWKTGYSEGFDVWDTSAIAPGMADGDSSITSDRLGNLAIDLLSRKENVTPVFSGPGGGPPGSRDGQPRRFFAWFHFFDPHAQYVPHPEAPPMGAYGGDGPPPMRHIYDQETWFTDKHIGRVIDYVQSQPWGEDTAIILTADHGEAFGDHGVRTHGHELWEPLIRVPLVLYVPGAEPRRVAARRSLIDLAPTLVDLTGTPEPPPGELRGISLLDDVFAPLGAGYAERDVYVDMPEGPFNDVRRAILTGPSPGMKLIHFGGRRYQLYDLAKDPGELEDLSKDPARLAPAMESMQQLRSRLKEIAVGR